MLSHDTAYLPSGEVLTLPMITPTINYTENMLECMIILAGIEDTNASCDDEMTLIHHFMHGAKKNRPLMRDAYDFIHQMIGNGTMGN